jgi:LacI family transcriptional regulator
MRDVATLAGVSLRTVSRTINGDPTVSTEMSALVQNAIRLLEYRPNLTASNLRRADRKTATIGLVLEDVGNPFSSALNRAIEDVARQRGLLVFAGSSDQDPEREQELLSSLMSRQVDGLIVVPAGGDHSALAIERQRWGLPVVFVDRPGSFLEADSVTSDNRAGARAAVSHLAGFGHRRIAFLGDQRTIWTAAERHAGYLEGLAAAGVAGDARLVRQDVGGVASAERAMLEMLALQKPPTAAFTGQNLITIGAVRALRHADRQHRFAVVGFDDFELADLLDPAISVVAQNVAALGREAAEMLLARIDGDIGPSRHLVLPVSLQVRGSGEIPAGPDC